ncbi:MAG: DNA polymerase III subunit delta [Chloroflexi bacterium RBG_13_53_26]|nr:MAG: DNA polymerase III subunit delta [Chloroflexi bacterium RBG_13_53_26]
MIYILIGADDFSLREKLAELKRGWGDEESLALNTTVFDGRHLTLPQLLNACNTPPFLAANRLVIVEGMLGRFEQKTGGRSPDFEEWKKLGDGALNMPPSNVLVLIDGEVAGNNPLYKNLVPISEVWHFAPLKGSKLQQWISSRVAKCGGDLSPQAMRLLTELGGEDLGILANEIDKLCLYAYGRRIEAEDVRQVTSYVREASVFPMIDAIVERRVSVAMRLMHQSLTEGMTPPYLLVMLTRQLRLMVQAVELSAQGVSLAKRREQLGVSPKYPIEKLVQQSAGYSMSRLVRLYEKLLETDTAIKTGKWKDELGLDLLVAELCCQVHSKKASV